MSPSDTGSSKRRYSVGQIVLLVIGIILLLPGGCALVFIGGMLWDTLVRGYGLNANDPFFGLAVIVWVISVAISAAGVALIWTVGRARRRAETAAAGGNP